MDTDKGTTDLVTEHLRSLKPEVRFQKMLRLCQFGRELMITGIKEQYPECTEEEIRCHFAERLHGREFVEKYLLVE